MSDDPHAQIKADIANAEADDDVAFLFSQQECLSLADAIPADWWAEHGGRLPEAIMARMAELEADNTSLRMARDAEKHCRLKDNEYLIGERDWYRAELRRVNRDAYGSPMKSERERDLSPDPKAVDGLEAGG